MFSEKVQAFIEGRPLAVTEIAAPEYAGVALKNVQNPARFLFEDGARLEAPLLNGQHMAFFGAQSYINPGGYLRDHVFVGRYCSIGRRVTIGAGSHAISGVSSSPVVRGCAVAGYSPEEAERLALAPRKPHRPTLILNDVWIGDGAVILPGVTIGTGAVVGANAVVTRDVAPYAIVAGAPARLLRYRFQQLWRDALLQLCWWDYPLEVLNTLPTSNILRFLEALERETFPKKTCETFRLKVRQK